MSNGSGTLLDIPTGYDLDIARTCSFVVNVACDMCAQWIAQGSPQLSDEFTWQVQDTCPITNSVFNVADFAFSGPIWSTFTPPRSPSVSEPFAIAAYALADPGTVYLAFRGSQTADDLGMDREFGLADYDPPTAAPGADIMVERGFYSVFNGLDQTSLTDVLKQVATSGGRLVVTGHSLGSTLATLTVPLACANDISSANVLQYNQASPRVGDSGFQTYYENLGVQTFRLVNTYDLVPKLPPWPYLPVGVEVDFGAEYSTEQECHSPCCSYSYALFNLTAPYNPEIGTCMAESNPEMIVP